MNARWADSTNCNLQIFRVTEPRAHNWVSRRGPLNDRGELINVNIKKRYFDREIKVAYKLNDGSEKIYLAHGRVFMDNIFFSSERETLTGSTEVDVGFAMDGNTPYDWCYTITNETGEKLTSFDTVITREGQKEYAYRRTEELAPGAFIDVGYSIMPALTTEEKADIRTYSDTASIYYSIQVTACSESGKIYDEVKVTVDAGYL